ncbi:hypothetical protein MJO28_003431, partial [Puccinia striiformis f. sp. tritici]
TAAETSSLSVITLSNTPRPSRLHICSTHYSGSHHYRLSYLNSSIMVLRALFYIFTIVRFKSINQDNRHVYTDPSGSQTPIAPSAGDKVADPNIFFKKGRLEKASLPPIPKGDDGDPDPTLSLDKAHKPQIPIQNAPFSRLLAWDASLPLHRGNVSVVDSRTGSQIYTIMPVPAKRGSFMIADEYGEMVLQARYKIKGRCGEKFTYNTFSKLGASYTVYPWVDDERWMMNTKGNGRDIRDQKLKYSPRSGENKGQVTFSSDGHRAADFESNQRLDKSQWEADTVGAVQSFSTLKIEETTLGDHYFIALWVMVKYRIEQCVA